MNKVSGQIGQTVEDPPLPPSALVLGRDGKGGGENTQEEEGFVGGGVCCLASSLTSITNWNHVSLSVENEIINPKTYWEAQMGKHK